MKKIYLIDANSFIYRMFYGVPEFKISSGESVNAVFGIAKFFLVQLVNEKPDYILFIKDAKGENFRHNLDKNYKATRDKMPDSLKNQIPIIEEMVKKMNVSIIEISGVEADDVIGTLAKRFNGNNDYEVYILSGDKDLYSLVSENVKIYDTMKKKKYGLEEVYKKFGVSSGMVIDYLAIVGDKADNIPGIDGFGPKKAVDLINIIGGVEEIYNFIHDKIFPLIEEGNGVNNKRIEKEIYKFLENKFGEEKAKKVFPMLKGKTFEKLLNSEENAFLSKKLATIKLDVELKNFDLEDYKFRPENFLNKEVIKLFRKLEFNSLIPDSTEELKKWDDLGLKINIIGDKKGLDDLFQIIKKYKEIIIDIETTSIDIMKAQLVGISIYLDDNNIFYINRLHNGLQINDEDLRNFLRKLFELDIIIVGHNIKYDLEIIYLFLEKEIKKQENNNFGQISLEI